MILARVGLSPRGGSTEAHRPRRPDSHPNPGQSHLPRCVPGGFVPKSSPIRAWCSAGLARVGAIETLRAPLLTTDADVDLTFEPLTLSGAHEISAWFGYAQSAAERRCEPIADSSPVTGSIPSGVLGRIVPACAGSTLCTQVHVLTVGEHSGGGRVRARGQASVRLYGAVAPPTGITLANANFRDNNVQAIHEGG